jgi:hypothetical protein
VCRRAGEGGLSGESWSPGARLALAAGRQWWAPHCGGGRKARPGRAGQPWTSGGVWTGREGGRGEDLMIFRREPMISILRWPSTWDG